jgi:hypothetical protein
MGEDYTAILGLGRIGGGTQGLERGHQDWKRYARIEKETSGLG